MLKFLKEKATVWSKVRSDFKRQVIMEYRLTLDIALWYLRDGVRALSLVEPASMAEVQDWLQDQAENDEDPRALRLLRAKVLTPALLDAYLRDEPDSDIRVMVEARPDFKEIEALFGDTVTGPRETNVEQVTKFLAKLIEQALKELVVKAFAGKVWMQDCARAIVKGGNAVTWVTPGTGFPVFMDYPKTTKKQIDSIVMGGARVQLALQKDTGKLDGKKAAQAVSPNLVHSLDAAALILTVQKCKARGIQEFSMVHDSFATHAGNCDIMEECLREAYVELFESVDVVEWFRKQWQEQLPEGVTLPENCPEKGNLDIRGVLDSEYFFA